MLNVMKLVEEEPDQGDGRAWFRADPDTIYPTLIAYLRDDVYQTSKPVSPALVQYRSRLNALPRHAFDAALLRKEELDETARGMRTAVLELARLWFTEVLHSAIDYAPMGLRLVRREHWQL